jgi:uracil DNA glycosylase
VTGHLPTIHEALGSSLSMTEKKKKPHILSHIHKNLQEKISQVKLKKKEKCSI